MDDQRLEHAEAKAQRYREALLIAEDALEEMLSPYSDEHGARVEARAALAKVRAALEGCDD